MEDHDTNSAQARTGCLSASRMWDVATEQSRWEPAEQVHLLRCSRCQGYHEQILAQIGQKAAVYVRVSGGDESEQRRSTVSPTRDLSDGNSAWLSELRESESNEPVRRLQETGAQENTLASAMDSTRFDQDAIHKAARSGGKHSDEMWELKARFNQIRTGERLAWHEEYPLLDELGRGGQGIVFRSVCDGTDGFEYPVAIKVFSPSNFTNLDSYEEAMRQMAGVASKTAQIRDPNFVHVQRFERCGPIRVMIMELVDGFDLRRLLAREMLDRLKTDVPTDDWRRIESKIITQGLGQSRLLPAVATHIMRACLSGLASLHRRDIVHADIKPSNIMLRSPFAVKIIDFGSAIDRNHTPHPSQWTRHYAAPEMARRECSPLCDLASLGYVLVELLAGHPLFAGLKEDKDILAAKLALPQEFTRHFPKEFQNDALLMKLCRKLIEPDPDKRFQTAEEAGTLAYEHSEQLSRAGLNMDVCDELRRWIDVLSNNAM